MITKFKIYEQINIGEPKIGDYVVLYSRDGHVGQIIEENDSIIIPGATWYIEYNRTLL